MQPLEALREQDPELFASIAGELQRQETQLELIASENHTSLAVMGAQGSVLTNKYAEGYPGKRYYGGCEFVDKAEELAKARVIALFGGERANVQPHSGTQANMAALMALAEPHSRVLAMSLDHGGHLSHGHPKNFSGLLYEFHHFGVEPETERIDPARVAAMARELKPAVLLIGASAYPRTLDFPRFAEIAAEVGAKLMVDMAHIAGLVAAGVHPSPVPHSDIVTFTTHKTLRGPRGGAILCRKEHFPLVQSRVFPGTQGGPLMHVIAAKAAAFGEALQPSFRTYQQQVVTNARALSEELQAGGLRIVSGGTDTHLMLVDLRSLGITGSEGEDALHHVGITVNKNLIPFDPQPATKASGVRIGTPAITTRGLREPEVRRLGALIVRALKGRGDASEVARVGAEVLELCRAFPVYPSLQQSYGLRD
ncbi:MAG: serine hydroxymethyltransferase [Planctomycetes bacterium]|nr:serine hydroxymethyltransferase [Planctomycetota bacterium]